ncbi:L,D-transpeptidase catalytic domain [Micromonospora pattaloongensis]|uniref:L,D-transpeptidase catalytic domain n=1 Tax=Micromonospora pattaloongensis TaxID=405436 RepID=A0A1H3NQ83_9ACTN|nr:Ig-like domain-containing protein [Micromonospora pattaloongensis]SDY90948.1 L,D-transpeptidase catalytic domain [Micromonospora pattaloongensis]
MKRQRRVGVLVAMVAAAPLVMTGCTDNPIKKGAPPPTVALTPGGNAADVPVSTELGVSVTGGKVTEVAVTDAKGAKVDGVMRADGASWLPDRALRYSQSYTARVTAVNNKGKTTSQSTTFTTMKKPAKQTKTTLYVKDNETYGTALPVAVDFDPGIPKDKRADVQRRLFVTTDPPQPGVWHWTDDGKQVMYRAPEFWQSGTKIGVRAALGGLPMGNGSYGDSDRGASAKIGDKVSLEIDGKTKQMKVFKGDKLTKKIPVSLGKPGTPSSSGKMVIMEKFEFTVFDTTGSADPYVTPVDDAQRLTWGGEFIHSAPWSVGSQGYDNVSHGCTNVSPEDANWLMKVTHVGDLVTVTGTEAKLDPGNGWTAWNMSWEEYVKGSALPVPEELKARTAPSPAGAAPAPSPTTAGR